jgi:hypothetical protein
VDERCAVELHVDPKASIYMPRLSCDVIQELLDEMNRIVTYYPAGVARTGTTIDELIAGTAVFPGGSGLWRGDIYGGDLPLYFPENPTMFIGHNFDSVKAYSGALNRKGEVKSDFWKMLKNFLREADNLDPADCFFTNALMGLKPGGASGPMPCFPGYKEHVRNSS